MTTLADTVNPLSNPEFRRYLWTEFSTHRLIAMPLLLGLAFLGANAAAGPDGVDQAAKAAMFVLAVIWGGRQAAGAVTDEVVGGTWDSQRMNAVGPWSLTWGKLLGATAYTWYGVAICLLVMLGVGITGLDDLPSLILTAVIAQGSALFVGMVLQRGQRPSALLGTVTLGQVSAIGVAAILASRDYAWSLGSVHWWLWSLPGDTFLLASQGAAVVWVLAGVHALMRDELRYRPQPWTWLAFLVFVAVYAAGFAESGVPFVGTDMGAAKEVTRLTAAFVTVTGLTLWAAVMSLNDSVTLRRWLAAPTPERDRPISLLLEAPAWVTGLAMSVLLAMGLTGALTAVSAPPWASTLTWSMVLFLIRDIGVVLTVNLDSDRRRGTLGAIIYLVALYVLLPLVLQEAIPTIAMALRPTAEATITGSLIPALGQAVGAWALVAWRWRRAGQGLSAMATS